MLENGKVEFGKLTVGFATEIDDMSDLSWLGEFVDKPEPFVIDRQQGILYGDYVEEPEEPWEPEPDDFDSSEDYDKAMQEYESALDEYDKAWGEWDKDFGLKRLDSTLGCTMGRNGYRYFKPENTEDQEYMIQDWKRVEEFNRGSVVMLRLIVSIGFNGYTVGSASLWGIESDSSDAYCLQTIQELVPQAVEEANVTLRTRLNAGKLTAVLTENL